MTVYDADIIQQRIDTGWAARQEDSRRGHLGGSLIGKECSRELWYSFRWATDVKHQGQILRLFDRGHKEEFRFVEYLQQIGIEVREYSQRLIYNHAGQCYECLDWDDTCHVDNPDLQDVTSSMHHITEAQKNGVNVKQWRVNDANGHFGGSLDGIAYGFATTQLGNFTLTEKDPVLLEFKTHGQKSFDSLIKLGLKDAKPEHYAQMQIYMVKRGLKFGLYMAVNKNTDELKCFFVTLDSVFAAGLIGKAADIVSSAKPPRKISTNPSWYKCRFCDHRRACHMGKPVAKNCRTCKHSKPVDDGQWRCSVWESIIPKDAQKVGCDNYEEIGVTE